MKKTSKKLLLTCLIAILIAGCTAYKQSMKSKKYDLEYTLTDEELSEYKHCNDTIYYRDTLIGIINNIEYEYIPSSEDGIRLEISVTQIGWYSNTPLLLFKYIHTLHSKAKIEVNRDETINNN
jgi:hypothetical protein